MWILRREQDAALFVRSVRDEHDVCDDRSELQGDLRLAQAFQPRRGLLRSGTETFKFEVCLYVLGSKATYFQI